MKRQNAVLRACWRMKSLSLLALLTVLSAIWSQDRAQTLHFSLFILLTTLFAYYLTRRFSVLQQMQLFLLGGTLVGVASLLLALFVPIYGVHQSVRGAAWQGIFVTKNELAMLVLFFMTPIGFVRLKYPILRYLYLGLSFLLIYKSESKTGLICGVLYLIAIPILYTLARFGARSRLAVLTIVIAAILVLGIGVSAWAPPALSFLGKDATLTGRTSIWAAVLPEIQKRPILGYGYNAFWTGLKGESAKIILSTGWLVPYAHNGYLDILLALGACGLLLVGLTIYSAIKDAWTCLRFSSLDRFGWYLSIVLLTVVYNINEGTFLAANSLPWIMYILACTGLSFEAERVKRIEKSDAA